MVNEVLSLPQPSLYDRHVYFLDFRQFNRTQPVYINMVRDPVDRVVSRYYFMNWGWNASTDDSGRSKSPLVRVCVISLLPLSVRLLTCFIVNSISKQVSVCCRRLTPAFQQTCRSVCHVICTSLASSAAWTTDVGNTYRDSLFAPWLQSLC